MATYYTYQEAKIANPEFDIYSTMISNGGRSEVFGAIGFIEKITSNFNECNPADYCMTVERFLSDGHRLVDGDVYLNLDGEVVEFIFVCDKSQSNRKIKGNDARFILRAAALEKPFLQTGEDFEHTKTLNFIRDRLVEVHGEPKNLDYMHKLNNAIAFVEDMENKKAAYAVGAKGEQEKPKRTKVEYVRVEYNKPWEVIKLYDDGVELFKSASDELQMEKINSIALRANSGYDFYRRVETEITERQEFIDEVCAINEKTHGERRQYLVESLFDSGRVKLIN